MFSGYKTYVVAILMAFASLASAFGMDLSMIGIPLDPLWGQHLLEAFGLAALRSGVASMKG